MTRTAWIEIPVAQPILGQSGVPAACMKQHPHVTLHHLGSPDDMTVARVVEMLRDCEGYRDPFKAELTGIGTFYRGRTQVPVILVNSREAVRLWSRVEAGLRGLGVDFDQKFGFIPHVALEGFRSDGGNAMWMADFRAKPWTVDAIQVVVKDKTKQESRRVEAIRLGPKMYEDQVQQRPVPHARFDTSDEGGGS